MGVKLKKVAVARFVWASRQRCFILDFPVSYPKPEWFVLFHRWTLNL